MFGTTPQAIVAELDRYIVGQEEAKRALALALRERERRKRLPEPIRSEIGPKNILLIGPTGVGKTELARRLARLVDAPFIKVEATAFTEVGYVGRDVESIVRDLADVAVNMVHQKKVAEVQEDAERAATDRLVNYLLATEIERVDDDGADVRTTQRSRKRRRRAVVAQMLANHELDERVVEIELDSEENAGSMLEFVSGMGSDEIAEQFHEFMHTLTATRRRARRMPVREARRLLVQEEANKLIDFDEVVEEALLRTEDSGIVFIDEIDKLINRGSDFGPDVSGEGVQRDLLPIIEGTAVATRYGIINTDHILFIAAGAFNRARPADLLPELQGRFPLRVEFKSLSEDDFVRILTEPENALVKQYAALLETEGVALHFTDEGVREVARIACRLNEQTENLGARRLYGVMEKVLEEINFSAPEYAGQTVVIDADYVRARMAQVPVSDETSKFIL
jgi:ATP-dependent HslUV protease ATP-binding subunit HslU